MTTEAPPAPIDDEAGDPAGDPADDGFGFETAAEPAEQVSSFIAIIRIIAVLGMGLSLSFGLFISLVGVTGLLIGIPVMLLSIPCFVGMQYAERWAHRHATTSTTET